ncbi:54S ribosomal protein L1, mitochondrial [[Candida] railenensis]|uniref:54S ribosomal protein L1, mitochondrial n=1 Tax=[Candida] railenensis TaxID=45579 RepID=A0A9P0W0S4_9ASCO|nr:54S ribosomal protein L1, mitochondrial [[Candida] railenensis]
MLKTTINLSSHRIKPSVIERLFSTSPTSSYAAAHSSTNKEADAKKKLKKFQKLKLQHQSSPRNHPLYMEVPQALRYLRASSVGQPASQAIISILMTVVPDRGSKPLNGSIFFPKPLKETRILVFTAQESIKEQCKEAGAFAVGGADLVEQIKNGSFSLDGIDKAFATPDMVHSLTPLARTLGVKGLMPMIKKGTVSEDVLNLIKENLGSLPFKQKGMHVAVPIGRCDFTDKEIISNLKAASSAIFGAQPAGTKKPNIIGQTVLNATRGPGIVIDFRQ